MNGGEVHTNERGDHDPTVMQSKRSSRLIPLVPRVFNIMYIVFRAASRMQEPCDGEFDFRQANICDVSSRYKRLGERTLTEYLSFARNRPQGHPERSMSLNNLAADLCSWYKQLRTIEDLDEAITLRRNVVALCSLGRLKLLAGLARHLRRRFARSRQL